MQPHLFVARLPDEAYTVVRGPLKAGKFKSSALNPLRGLPTDEVMGHILSWKVSGFATNTLRKETLIKGKRVKTVGAPNTTLQ